MLLKFIGLVFVGLAILGVFLPLLPTTPFLLVAATCFAKSSPRFYQLLINNKVFGPLIINWQASRSIPKKAKFMALVTMLLAVCWSVYLLPGIWWQVLLVALVIGPFIFVARLPITKN